MNQLTTKWIAGLDDGVPVVAEICVHEGVNMYRINISSLSYSVQHVLHWMPRIPKDCVIGRRFFDTKAEAIECVRAMLVDQLKDLEDQLLAVAARIAEVETL